MLRSVATLLAILAGAAPSSAAAAPTAPEPVQEALVREVVDGDTLVLDSGTHVRLVGIQAPKLPLGRPGFRKWPLADKARKALADITAGRRVRLFYGGRNSDRHGRLLAHLHIGERAWVQGRLLSLGMARVYSFPDNRARIAEMLKLERAARGARRGIWGHEYYRVRTAETAGRFIDTFQLVEGRVKAVAVVRGRAFLNFGADWRSDFTISIKKRHLRRFRREGVAMESYRDRRIRVRGWLKSYNGPMIEVTHPEQIEVLDP